MGTIEAPDSNDVFLCAPTWGCCKRGLMVKIDSSFECDVHHYEEPDSDENERLFSLLFILGLSI